MYLGADLADAGIFLSPLSGVIYGPLSFPSGVPASVSDYKNPKSFLPGYIGQFSYYGKAEGAFYNTTVSEVPSTMLFNEYSRLKTYYEEYD